MSLTIIDDVIQCYRLAPAASPWVRYGAADPSTGSTENPMAGGQSVVPTKRDARVATAFRGMNLPSFLVGEPGQRDPACEP